MDFDYLVGSRVKGFEDSVKISEEDGIIVIEGDEYLSSAIDDSPKFLWYKPDITLISGIAWDHMNVFPTFDIYKAQFENYIKNLREDTKLIYCSDDKELSLLVSGRSAGKTIPYGTPGFELVTNKFVIKDESGNEIQLNVYGSHNLTNIEGARLVCRELGIDDDMFYKHIVNFTGAGKRLEVINENESFIAFRDFAHSPSKVKGTIEGIKDQYRGRKIIACLELHTYSSLNSEFLPEYRHTADRADIMMVYINPEAVRLKKMEQLSEEIVRDAFGNQGIQTFFDLDSLRAALKKISVSDAVFLFMSSGDFDGWNIHEFLEDLDKNLK
jgi:UDP-N-acetylmuramate: L-alanyl-gamma-D-glutamyl-meso-diaminopimelate ligase